MRRTEPYYRIQASDDVGSMDHRDSKDRWKMSLRVGLLLTSFAVYELPWS